MISVRIFLGALVLVFAVTFGVTGGLRHEPAGDESHFLKSSEVFHGWFGVEALRSYPEVVTPFALVIWGELDYVTGDGLFYGRLLNLFLTFALVCFVAFSAPRSWPRGALAAVGLLLFPYTVPLAAHLYTDTLSAFLAVAGTLALLRGRPVLAFLAFSCAIATRQYMVQIPAALAAAEALGWLGGRRGREKAILACVASCFTVLAWVAFFGGLANEVGLADWVPFYPAPMMTASNFIMFHGLYSLTGVGAFFVVVEAVLFRRHPVPREMRSWRGAALALGLACFFWLDPPVMTWQHPGGPFGRTARVLLPAPDYDWARVALYYVLALLGTLRFAGRLDAGFWMVAAATVLAMKQQLAWEKYLYPTLAVLWTLVSLGELSGYRARSSRSEPAENEFTKQALPASGFH